MAGGSGRFEHSSLQQWKQQEAQPAAPAGMRQGAQAAGGYESGGGRFENSKLGQWVSEQGYTGAAQTWYTGANREGTNNGWDTDYWARAMAQRDQLANQGKLGQQFEQANATGVVTWDHDSSDGRHHFSFGDVYDNGRKVGNVLHQFDKDTANLMMADILFDGKTKAEIFSDSDRVSRLAREVAAKREQNNTDIPKALTAADFNEKVAKRAKSFEDGHVDEAITAGGVLGGAAVGAGAGAAAGAAFFGVGALPGAIGGAIIGALGGGAGAEMNKDALAEQAARAYEITSMSKRENGTGAAVATGVSQWSGFAGSLISPLQNLNRGYADVRGAGRRGDGRSEFYRVDDKGERTVPAWLRVTDVVAAVGDSALQFASPIGMGLYSTQMSGTIGGEVAELGLTHGKTFDYTRGDFDNIFTDDHGHRDLSAAAAGIGKIGIDAVQLGMVRGLGGKVDMARAAVGEKSAFGSLLGMPQRLSRNVLPARLGGRTAEERAALAAGGRETEAAGHRFVLDAEGKVVGTHKTMSLLAPSEQLVSVSARVQAARLAAKAKRTTVSADDFYRAADALATGQSRWRTALVNGMGEGYEEAAQAILEPHSHNDSVSMSDIGNAALYGFAMGAGMGVGMGARTPSADEKMMHQAFLAQSLRSGTEGDLAEFKRSWKSKTEAEKRSAAAMSNLERATTTAAYRKLATDQAIERSAGVVGTAKLRDAIAQQLASNLAKANPRIDGSFTIAPVEDTGKVDAQGNLLPGSMPGDAVVASGLQTVRNLSNRIRGHEVQVESLNRDIEQVAADLAKDPGNQDLADRQQRLATDLATAQRVVDRGNEILADLDARLDRMYDPTLSAAQVQAEVETANQILRDLFHERTQLSGDDARAAARAVSMLLTRDPQDQAGSYQVLVPQISVPLTISRTDDLLQVPSGILSAISGDHDGDKMRPQNELILSEEDFVSARSGAFFLGAGSTVNIAAPKDEKENVERMSQALASTNTALANYAAGTLTTIGSAIRHRYGAIVEARVLDAVLDRFNAEVHANNKNARDELVNGLARLAGGPITEFARGNLSNEWLWLDHLLRANFQQFQENFAAHRPLVGEAPNTTRTLPNRQSTAVKERRMAHAANTGTTVGLLLAGDSPFRQSQKLHYSSLVANVLSAEQGGARQDVYALAQLYEALGQGLTRTELEEIRAKDEITGRVYARLKRIALEAQRLDPSLGGVESLAVVANLRLADIDVDVDGTPTLNGKQISLAQFLLKQSIQQDRREKDAIYDASPELQAKHLRLLAMTRPPTQGSRGSRPVNAERAFVEIVGSQQLFTLLGDAANVFGPHLTVEQWIRGYVSLDEHSRRAEDRRLRAEAEYLGRKSKTNLPYDLAEVSAGEVSAYRALVDAMLAVGHNRITIDAEVAASKDPDSKHLHGELANRHYETSAAFQDAHTRIRESIFSFLGLSRRRSGELSADVVARMFEDHPDFARQVMALIPNNYANAVLEARGDGVYVANWVHDMFVMSNSAEAEMHFWRNLLIAEWNAKGMNFSNEEEDDDGANGRKYHNLKRRMHRIMFNLAAQDDNGLLYEKFIREMETATSLEGFLRWVNTTPGIRGDQAPIVGWVDDPAEFDADKAGGGWTTALAGSELREAIASLQKGADALVKDLAEETASVNADVSTIAAIRRVLNGTGTTDDQVLHDQLAQRIRDAGEMSVGLGPQAMIYEIVGAARGFYPQAHTKGANPPHLVAPGSFDAWRDAFGYTTNYERVLAALTATNLDAVSNNMAQVAKDGGRTMDDFGRPVVWSQPSVAQVLDLLEDADTRPMARAMLFPQAMERTLDGSIRPQLLVGKSLVSLLDGTSLKDLFPKGDTLRQDPALRYLTMVQAEARRFGGHFSVMRAATDIVTARQSAADHTLSDFELEKMTVEALHEIAQVLQASGSVAAADVFRNTDTLSEYLTNVRKAQKQAHLSRNLGQEVGDETATKAVIDDLVAQRKTEAEAEKQAILDALGPNATQAEVDRAVVRTDNIDAEVDRFEQKMATLLDDNLVGTAVSMYGWPKDQAAQVGARRTITDFIMSNFHMMETSSANLLTLSKLTEQLRDSGRAGNVDLSDAEWDELSRAVIGVYLDRAASSTGAGISVAPFPDEDHAADHRYYDRTFSYLAEPLMDPTSPLVQAAKWVHERAYRHGEETREEDFYKLLNRTLFAEFSLGQWTSDIPRASIEANQRLDSSSAEAAIAMPGNSPKRQAVISAATRRTFAVPGDEHMSTVRLNWLHLARPVFDEVDINLPSGTVSRPLAQLNNRFARSVLLTYTDAAGAQQQVDLLATDRDLGRVWHGDGRAAGAGLQEIHLDRIAQSVDKHMTAAGLSPARALLDIEFVHPDSQPEGPEWFNNLFFEGTSFKLDGDRHESLNETLWFSSGGLNQSYQRAALDASKTGKPALQVVPTPASADVATFEQNWQTDFGAMLRAKTRRLFESDLGIDVDPAEFYNAVYKDLKLRHFVRGEVDGQPVLWSAEQVLAFHQANPGMVPPIDNATLWIPSDDVLRSLLGEQGTQGVLRIFDDQLEIDPAMVPTYRGVTDSMRERFAAGLASAPVELAQTRVAARARQSQLVVRARMDDAARSAYDTRMRFLAEQREEIHSARAAWSGQTNRDQGGFSPKQNLAAALQRADGMLRAENIAFDWAGMGGIPFIGPRSENNNNLSRMLIRDLEAMLADGQTRTGWIFREGDPSHPPTGLLSGASMDNKEPALRIASGDVVVVELDSFKGDWKQAAKRIDYLANRGATIVLGSGDGSTDGRPEMAEHLDTLNYERIAGSKHVYRPAEFSSRYANQRARTSTLMEMRPVSRRNQVAILNVVGKGIQEGGAWVDHDNPRLRAIGTTLNLVPTDFLAGFNVPVEQVEDEQSSVRVAAVIAHLRGFDSPEGRDHLRQLAGAENDATFDPAWDALMRRLDDNRVLPAVNEEFGTGDFIPLVDGLGRVLLYRHGMKAPRRDQVDTQADTPMPGELDGARVAVFPSKPEETATTHRGRVVEFRPRSGYGLSVELEIDLKTFGEKHVLEWNGMKYILTPRPADRIAFPDHGFFPDWGIDIVVDTPGIVSKEAYDGLVNNHRQAFANFGIDFTADVARYFGVDERTAVALLHGIATRAERIPTRAADELLNSTRPGSAFLSQMAEIATAMSGQVDPGWVNRLEDEQSVEAQIVRAMVIYLSVPGARVDDVLRSGGFNDDTASPEAQSLLMPRLFTQVFDNAPLGSALRTEMFRRFNEQLYNPHNDGTGYVLHPDWSFESRHPDPKKRLVGHLQFAEAHSSGDSPVKNGMSFDEAGTQGVSAHAAATAYQAIGARTASSKDLSRARDFATGKGLTRFERDTFDGGAWRMLTGIDTSSGARWRAQSPAEAARRSLARDAVVQFRQPLATTDENGWDANTRKAYADVVRQVLNTLHLQDTQTELVDFWVRQMLGSPAGVDKDGNDVGKVSPKAAIESAKDVLWNVERGYLPLVTAMVPLTHIHDLQAIYRANRSRPDKWVPKTALDADATPARDWNDWVKVSLGSAFTTDDLFDPLYLLALDGHLHTYQAATRDLLDLPVSMDAMKSVDLLLPETNEMLVSLDPNQDLLAREPGLLDVTRASLDDMIGGQRIAGVLEGKAAPASEIAKKRETIRKWRKENGVPVPVDATMRNFRKNGAQFIEHSTTTNALARGLINLRVGTAMINPALYVSMGPEQWVRGTLDRAANLLTGQSTAGATGALAAKVGLSRFSPEQVSKLTRLYEQLGQRRDFKAMVYGDLMFLRPHEPGVGRIERWLENYAKFGSKMQDPTWGMRATTLARRYLEAALQHIDAMPTETALTPDRLVAELTTDPQFLKTNFPEVHQSAVNSIAQLRSLKQTTASSMIKGIYEPFSTSTHSSVNFLGNVLLKMPLIFSGYAMNVLTTITGLQGLDAVVAASLHGRSKGPASLIGRAQAAVEGVEFDELKHGQFDMSSVMDGIDLSRAFIRGGLTHTALFAFGMAAGGLGLSGEDDETKKRKRLAKLQGAGYVYDPRALENDFRNADSVFMDWLPFGSQWWGVGEDVDGQPRSIGQLHWTLKQFVSPLLGFERFYETGDFRQVTWGFQDAIGSFPLINSLMWHDAVATANEFASMANDEAGKPGGPANMVNSANLLANGVGVYERMLFENAFVNQLYSSFDRYDRDPYKLPLRDSDGELQRDIEGNARAQNLSVEQYLEANRDQLTREIAGGKWAGVLEVDPETGAVKQAYMSRDANSARLHALTENRATLAFAMSMFTGFTDSDYLRRNMPIKTREIEKPQVSQAEAEAIIRSLAGASSGGQPALTRDELTYLIKGQAIRNKDWNTWNNADALAAEGMKHMTLDPMSVLDEHGREVLTEAGARGIFQGLAKGTVKLGDQALQGIYIPFEMRESIQKKWMADLIQEGVDMGLDQTKATSRMKRLWYGPTDDPSIQGLGDILWHKDISYSGKAVYNQLNTTYVMGPDGMPWATGFTRDGLMGALGLKPVKRAYVSEQGATGTDNRLNTTDLVNGMNTGLRALELVDDSRYVPTDVEIGKSIEQAIKDAARQDYTPYKPYSSGGGGGGYGGYRKYGHYSGYRRRRGYGGGGYGGGGSYFTKMYALPHGASTYANNIPFINTSNPLIRRGDVRRERVWSERGRLKQWQ